MLFRINPGDSVPLYHQLARQVRDAVASGKLRHGDQLPWHRELAKELAINHLTVKQAYDTLEAEGIIATSRGRGTFIAHQGASDLLPQGLRDLEGRARDLVTAAQLLGLRPRELLDLVRRAWNREEP